ncbi:CSC1-like protein 1 [Eumeta japonica]|uniref:CSC1-like protein 1 n=1 Tax=Eumeta variegata TaxID=151549 RepID=A0A4C1WJX7_EUMVA|nr:CSC1-like protein 1 [Eumeta japonica]
MALEQRFNTRLNLFRRGGYGSDMLVDNRRSVDHSASTEESTSIDEGFFTWLPVVINLTREQILAKCGPDAVHYLSFQRHLITLMFIVTLVSVGIILPANFQGRKPVPPSMTGTIMITNIAKPDRNEATIKTYFAHQFPRIPIVDLRLAYNINQLAQVEEEKEMVTEARIYSDNYLKKTGKHITLHKKCCDPEVDALGYYIIEEKRLKDEAARCRAIALNHPLGVAFLTLPSYQVAQHVIANFDSYRGWVLSHATNPSDIIWENLSVQPGVCPSEQGSEEGTGQRENVNTILPLLLALLFALPGAPAIVGFSCGSQRIGNASGSACLHSALVLTCRSAFERDGCVVFLFLPWSRSQNLLCINHHH